MAYFERKPGRTGTAAGRRPPEDNRNIINSMLWNWNSIYRRFRRWSACGVWETIAVALAETR